MNLAVLGALTLSGFAHRWYFAFLLAIAGLVTLYVFMQLIRRKRILRFASMELLESVHLTARPGGGICPALFWLSR